jgi:hypothetical protein
MDFYAKKAKIITLRPWNDFIWKSVLKESHDDLVTCDKYVAKLKQHTMYPFKLRRGIQ